MDVDIRINMEMVRDEKMEKWCSEAEIAIRKRSVRIQMIIDISSYRLHRKMLNSNKAKIFLGG